MKIKAVFNRDGGTFKTTDMDDYCARATEAFARAGHDIECRVVAGADIVDALEKAAQEPGIEAILAGGGDGTISAAAGIAWKAGLPLGVIPAGTMNLFARALGLPLDIWAVLDVLAKAKIRAVDIATVGDRPFVHQFSAGLHARMVRLRDKMEFASRLGKMRASVQAALSVIGRPPRFEVALDIDHDGQKERSRVSAVSVSNNSFGNNPLMFAENPAGGHLGVYLADALKPSGALKLAIDIIRGRLKENEAVHAKTANSVTLEFSRSRHTLAVVDGELLHLPPKLEISIHPGELKVLAPEPQDPVD